MDEFDSAEILNKFCEFANSGRYSCYKAAAADALRRVGKPIPDDAAAAVSCAASDMDTYGKNLRDALELYAPQPVKQAADEETLKLLRAKAALEDAHLHLFQRKTSAVRLRHRLAAAASDMKTILDSRVFIYDKSKDEGR